MFVFLIPQLAFSQAVVPIKDNSFLIEEAYNQEKNIVQHIFFSQFQGSLKSFLLSLTQEWPIKDEHHQFSYTILLAQEPDRFSLNNFLLNYRYQLLNKNWLALAPRFSVQMPVNKKNEQGWGLQLNIPASFDFKDKLFIHLNAGANFAWSYPGIGDPTKYVQVPIGAGIIYCPHPLINLMCEVLHTTNTLYRTEYFANGEPYDFVDSYKDLIVNPGIRCAINFKNGLQIVPGFAVPTTISGTSYRTGYQFYLSFEHQIKKS
ncbi:MAG: hypothetical protein NTV09_07980 [Bacteroidetes bacterium]|nr:hypothetical protein [Bacteroidota bacterium]